MHQGKRREKRVLPTELKSAPSLILVILSACSAMTVEGQVAPVLLLMQCCSGLAFSHTKTAVEIIRPVPVRWVLIPNSPPPNDASRFHAFASGDRYCTLIRALQFDFNLISQKTLQSNVKKLLAIVKSRNGIDRCVGYACKKTKSSVRPRNVQSARSNKASSDSFSRCA